MWTSYQRRLTLLIHPGRIKRGVNLREELGPVLRPDERYTLVIDRDLLDVDGRPLAERVKKSFTTTAEDHRPLRPEQWKLSPPTVATREPLVVQVDKPLDHALARRMLRIVSQAERPIAGDVTLSDDGCRWQFTPLDPWPAKEFSLVIDPALEDLAGNTPVRAFDTDLEQPAPAEPILRRSFGPRPASSP
jgi:hypothetical protein